MSLFFVLFMIIRSNIEYTSKEQMITLVGVNKSPPKQSENHTDTQITKTLGSTSIRHRSDTKVWDRFLIDVDPNSFAVWFRPIDGWFIGKPQRSTPLNSVPIGQWLMLRKVTLHTIQLCYNEIVVAQWWMVGFRTPVIFPNLTPNNGHTDQRLISSQPTLGDLKVSSKKTILIY